MMFSPMGALRDHIANFMGKAQVEPIVAMKHGRPVALIEGVDGMTIEEVLELLQRRKHEKHRKRD